MTPITIAQYVGQSANHEDWTMHTERQAAANELLKRVNAFLDHVTNQMGLPLSFNPSTNSLISGAKWGGFRTQDCPYGAPMSAHKLGQAIDIYDPRGDLDNLISKHPELLEQFDLYRESLEVTPTWCHLQTRKTKSGKRTFLP